jgi:hypothetical protein
MNVHNATAGVWSIARQDPSPSISLAAGVETFGMGLLEALSLYSSDPTQPVLYVYADEPLPEPFKVFADHEATLHAVALLIGQPATRHLAVTREPAGSAPTTLLPQCLQALHVLQSGQPQGPWVEASAAWSWRVD